MGLIAWRPLLSVAVLVVSLATAGARAASAPPPDRVQRADAERLLGPLRAFGRTTDSRRPETRQALETWSRRTAPCLDTLAQDLSLAPRAARLTLPRVRVIGGVLVADGLPEALSPVDTELGLAERSWSRIKLRVAGLRTLARAKARLIDEFRGGALLLDACAFYRAWRTIGFDLGRLPSDVGDQLARLPDGRAGRSTPAGRNLRKLARLVGRDRAARFDDFPFSSTVLSARKLLAPWATVLAAPPCTWRVPRSPAALPADAVACVAFRPILKVDLDHWLAIAAAGRRNLALPELRTAAHDQIMQLLISWAWIELEASDRGLEVSERAVWRAFVRQKRSSFRDEADFQKYLRDTAQSEADILHQVRMDLLTTGIRRRVTAPAKTRAGRQRRLERFSMRYVRLWRDRTVCGEAYRVSQCSRTLPIADEAT